MKRILLPLLLLLTLTSRAQTCGLLLFAEDGQKFKVSTNGTARNTTSQSEVKLVGFPSDIVKVHLEFDDKSTLDRTMYLRMGVIEHHRLSRAANGTWRVSFESDEEIPQPFMNTTVVTLINHLGGPSTGSPGQPTATTIITSRNTPCGLPLSDRSCYEFYGHLKGLTFDNNRVQTAKDAVRRDCFSSSQIKMLLGAFTYESSRLEFAKYAYDFVYDRGVYAIVREGFTNSLSGDELMQYVRGR